MISEYFFQNLKDSLCKHDAISTHIENTYNFVFIELNNPLLFNTYLIQLNNYIMNVYIVKSHDIDIPSELQHIYIYIYIYIYILIQLQN